MALIHAIAVRFQLLPDVIDISFVLVQRVGWARCRVLAASLRFDADRLARLVVLGNLFGAITGTVLLLLGALWVIS